MRFSSLISGGFITEIVVNPPENKWKNAPLCRAGFACISEVDFLVDGIVVYNSAAIKATFTRGVSKHHPSRKCFFSELGLPLLSFVYPQKYFLWKYFPIC